MKDTEDAEGACRSLLTIVLRVGLYRTEELTLISVFYNVGRHCISLLQMFSVCPIFYL